MLPICALTVGWSSFFIRQVPNLQHFWIFLSSWSVFQGGAFPSSTWEMRALLQVFSWLSERKPLEFLQTARWLSVIIFIAKNIIAPRRSTSDLVFPLCANVSRYQVRLPLRVGTCSFPLKNVPRDAGMLCWHVQHYNAWEFILTLPPAWGRPWLMTLRMAVWKPSSPDSGWAALKLFFPWGFCGFCLKIPTCLDSFLLPCPALPYLSPLNSYYIYHLPSSHRLFWELHLRYPIFSMVSMPNILL